MTRIDIKANNAWLKEHLKDYNCYWILLRDGVLLAFGDGLNEICQHVGELKGSGIVIAYGRKMLEENAKHINF